jgi:hypothetical protein
MFGQKFIGFGTESFRPDYRYLIDVKVNCDTKKYINKLMVRHLTT